MIVWDLASRRPAGPALTGHRAAVNTLAFNSDGTRLASGGGDGNIILWDVEKLQPVGGPWTASSKPVFSVAFAPDGRHLISNNEQHVVVWDVGQGLPLGRRFEGGDFGSSNMAFSPNGKTLAATDNYSQLTLWDVAAGRPIQQPDDGEATSVAFSADGKLLASVNRHGAIQLRNPISADPISTDKTEFLFMEHRGQSRWYPLGSGGRRRHTDLGHQGPPATHPADPATERSHLGSSV